MSRPVMWGVREAAGRFKREGLRAAERCQQSVKENVGELSGCVCEEKACHNDKKNSWRKTKSQSLWNRNGYANSLNAIERVNEWIFYFFFVCCCTFLVFSNEPFLQNPQESFATASSSNWSLSFSLFPPQKIGHSENSCLLVSSLLNYCFNSVSFHFPTLSRLSLPIIQNVESLQRNTILCEENVLVAVDLNSSKSHSG